MSTSTKSEGSWNDLFTVIAAFRKSVVDLAGRQQVHAGRVRDAGLDADADEAESIARELAAGLEQLTRVADGAQDDTQTMSLDDIAGED